MNDNRRLTYDQKLYCIEPKTDMLKRNSQESVKSTQEREEWIYGGKDL